MANLVRFDPFDDRFEDVFRGMLRPFFNAPTDAVQIKMDVTENDNAYVVRAEIPGVKRDDINVSIDANQVSIAAEVRREKEAKNGERVLRTERYVGKAYRSFLLGQDVDDQSAAAKYADGVLELTLPKKAVVSAKKLTIQ